MSVLPINGSTADVHPGIYPHTATLTNSATVLVVGTGLAGSRTVALLRHHGFSGRIVALGEEDIPGYDKPALSKQLLSRTDPAWLTSELSIDLLALADAVVLGDAVIEVRSDENTPRSPLVIVRTAGGRVWTGDAVVIATGSSPVRPPGWSSAMRLGTAADADALRTRLAQSTRSSAPLDLVVIGSGWIGAEVSGVAAQAGYRVAVVEGATQPLTAGVGEIVGKRMRPWYRDAGVDLYTGSSVVTLDEHAVTLSDGRVLTSEIVLAAVGAAPATATLGKNLQLDGRGRIAVDSQGQAIGYTGIYAVGDCAARPDPLWPTPAAGHWTAALHSPELAVRAMLGLEPTSVPAPYVFSTQLGHEVGLVGLPSAGSEVHWRELEQNAWSAAYVQPASANEPAQLTALLAVDAPREVSGARKVLARGPLAVDLTLLRDGTHPLRDAIWRR